MAVVVNSKWKLEDDDARVRKTPETNGNRWDEMWRCRSYHVIAEIHVMIENLAICNYGGADLIIST